MKKASGPKALRILVLMDKALVPPEVEELVLDMLEKDPDTRPDARQLAEQLAAWQPRSQA